MKHLLLALSVAAIPLAASAQTAPPPPPGPGAQFSPSPEMRARFEQMRTAAKTAAFGALTADHRTRVQQIVDQVAAGTVQPRDAVTQIDALLTPDEKTNVLAAVKAAHEKNRPPEAANQAPAPPPGPNGAPPPPGAPGEGHMHRAPDAGRMLLMFSLTPEQRQALRGSQHK